MNKLLLLALLLYTCCAWSQSNQKLFILLGQSNMAGRAEIRLQDTVPLTNVMLLNDKGEFETARNPLNRYSNIRKELQLQKVGLGYSFAQKVSEQLNDTIFLVVNAKGGTEIERFMKGDTTGYYEKSLARVKQALEANPRLRVKAIIWHQGESNSGTYDTYIENFNKLIAAYREDLDRPSLPVIVGEVGKWNQDYENINKVIGLIPAHITNSYVISSDGLTNCDKFHFDSASQIELGRRYAEKYLETIKK